MKKEQKRYFVWLAILLAIGLIFQTAMLIKANNEIQDYKGQNSCSISRFEDAEYLAKLAQIRKFILEDNRTPTEVIHAACGFVYNNSRHAVDSEHANLAAMEFSDAMRTILDGVICSANGNKDKKPHLSCGFRAYVLHDLLKAFKIESRLLLILHDDPKCYGLHRQLEVFNPETRQWEVWDPDYNVWFEDSDTGRRIGIIELLYRDLNQVTPMNSNTSGWEKTDTKMLLDGGYKGVMFEGPDTRTKHNLILINSRRFDLEKTSNDGLTFKDYALRVYNTPRVIIF